MAKKSRILAQRSEDAKAFYKNLLALKIRWDEFLTKGTKIITPEERVNDTYKAGLILAMENFEGREWPGKPKYGTGEYERKEHNTFPPATTAVANCLLDWGFTGESKNVVRYYLANYVRSDGTFRYYGPAPDEYGQMLDAAKMFPDHQGLCVGGGTLRSHLENLYPET